MFIVVYKSYLPTREPYAPESEVETDAEVTIFDAK